MKRMNILSGTALITGGARRIGRAMTLYLAERGFRIALHYHSSRHEAEKLAESINRNSGQCSLFPCDLSNTKEAAELVPMVFDQFNDCSLLINNASVFNRISFSETSSAQFDDDFNINFRAPFFLSQAFAKLCSRGQIINILDTKIKKNHTAYFTYSLSKKALCSFTKMAALELGPLIRVNGISPGLILPNADTTGEAFEKMARKLPVREIGGVDMISSVLGFLLDNPFVTGETIFVDGGEHLV